ncbi:hypothetical protein EYC84_000409 [Monilinia fructicola]|uniref:SH3 domain-containing protein n=1 Tax=Monilinia fructicola TaxID=38448 RepID=A0A5M9JNG6_MONFR|nr:hypothetical protein EYC84_000409 [Monilinia fructicola]
MSSPQALARRDSSWRQSCNLVGLPTPCWDEFTLERGDMLKVVGIWDDGWATGVMINERADEWDEKRKMQRDSGVSNTSGRREISPNVSGEIKAFPLVCVCLPDHWRRTIDGDGSTDSGGPPDSFHPSINRPYAHTQPGTLFTFDLHFMPRYVLDSTYGTTLHIPDLELMCFWISFNFCNDDIISLLLGKAVKLY